MRPRSGNPNQPIRKTAAAHWTFDVGYSTSKDTLKAGEVTSGVRRVTVDADDEVTARLLAEQMVASNSLGPWGAGPGNEPTSVELVGYEE